MRLGSHFTVNTCGRRGGRAVGLFDAEDEQATDPVHLVCVRINIFGHRFQPKKMHICLQLQNRERHRYHHGLLYRVLETNSRCSQTYYQGYCKAIEHWTATWTRCMPEL